MQGTQTLTLADAIFPRVESTNRTVAIARDLALMGGFAAFVALCAQIQVRLPWTPVPVTGQTFAVLVTGGALGARRGVGALVLYAIVGCIGLGVFTPASSATSGSWALHFILPWQGSHGYVWQLASGGYIVGFVVAAGVVGWLAERGWDRGTRVQLAMLLGDALVYIPGLYWLGHELHTPFSKTLEFGLYPFIVGDLMKLLLASLTLPAAWALVERTRHRDDSESPS